MRAVEHGVIIIYTEDGTIKYCSADAKAQYIEVLKKAGVTDNGHDDYMQPKEYEGYSISLNKLILGGRSYNMAHILADNKNVDHYKRLAYKDCLTGLYNRNFWEDFKDGLIGTRDLNQYTLILIDMDNLREINRKIGYKGGDRAIQTVAEAIKISVRDDDVVLRFGGDEFLIVLEDVDREQFAKDIIDRIRIELSELELYDELKLSISAGHAHGEGLENLENTIEIADSEMLKEKRHKRSLSNNVDYITLHIIERYIEQTRAKLNKMIAETEDISLNSGDLLRASQELDDLINIYMNIAEKTI